MVEKTKSSKALIVFGVLASLLLAGGGYIYAAYNAGREELRELCAKDGEPRVYKQVSAEGYFDSGMTCLVAGCWDVLLNRKYQFIEVFQTNAKPWKVINENGYYRIARVQIDSKLCDERALAHMKKSALHRRFLEQGECIAIEKIKSPSVRYGLFSDRLPPIRLNNWFDSVISRRHTYIKDMKTEELIVDHTTYLLGQNAISTFSSFQNVLHCRSRGIGLRGELPDIVNVEFYVTPE